MSDLFVAGQADLSWMDGTNVLCVAKVIHRAVVEVNEEGTDAAAATAIGMHLGCFVRDPSPNFRADHPFLFFIFDNMTGSVLFLGRVIQPE